LYARGAVTTHVTVADVVAVDEDDIGPGGGGKAHCRGQQQPYARQMVRESSHRYHALEASLILDISQPNRSADLQVCCIAGFQTCGRSGRSNMLPIWKSAIQQVWKP